jgi:hypothetical protein
MSIWSSWRPGAGRIRCWRWAYDLKVFTAVAKPPRRVRLVDVLGFMTAQRMGGEGRLQVGPGGSGVSARALRRRPPGVPELYGFLYAFELFDALRPAPRVIVPGFP